MHQHHGQGDVNRVNKILFSTRKCWFLFVNKLKYCTESYSECLSFIQCKSYAGIVKSFVSELCNKEQQSLLQVSGEVRNQSILQDYDF